MSKITKAVFPVAGMGSRFLPATKINPKEMLPVVDKPLIQYAVEEAYAAGITTMIFITGRNKRAIEDHFDKAYEMETELESRGKHELLTLIRKIVPKDINCLYIRQTEALGLGHAVLCAKPVIHDEPFAVLLADDLIEADNKPVMKQMAEIYDEWQCPVLGVQPVDPSQTGQYGIVKVDSIGERLNKITAIVEKPKPSEAPSNLGVVGRYILTSAIFDHLEKIKPGSGGEIQLTDGIASMMKERQVLAYEFSGTRYDCGSKLGYLKATVEYALKHPEVNKEFREYLAAKNWTA